MDQDDFNSSDIEFEDAPKPFAHAGNASIGQIIDHAFEDRIASKKASKQLTNAKVSKKTEYKGILWYRRFEATREHTLKTKGTPKGEEIVRFIGIITKRIRPISGDVPSYSLIRSGIRQLIGELIFHYEDFRVSPHESKRIDATINDLVVSGKLTRDPSRQKFWLGAVLIRKLAAAIVEDGFITGTLNWDVTIYKALSIVFIAALACRTGDIAKDKLDNQLLPYLCYSDITMKLVNGDDIASIQAQVTIRNEKAYKHDPSKNRIVLLKCLPDTKNNVICPVKLLLIHALRHGYVNGKSVDEVLSNAYMRRDRQIIWTNGQAPVFCAMSSSGAFLLLGNPASNQQARKIVVQAGLLCGILGSIVAHDIRRGAARDTAQIKSGFNGMATVAVSATLGHSHEAHFKGTTAAYVGGIDDDLWAKRVDLEYEDPFGLQVAAQPFPKRPRLTKEEITAQCEIDGADSSDTNKRRQASQKIRADSVTAWIHKEKNGTTATEVLNPNPKRQNPKKQKPLSELTPNQSNQAVTSKDAEWDDMIDPALLSEGLDLGYVLAGRIDAEASEEATNAAIDYMCAEDDPTTDLEISQLDFVKRFSEINITSNQMIVFPGEKSSGNMEQFSRYFGKSRDDPTPFQYKCSTVGCIYTSDTRAKLHKHETSCTVEKINAVHSRAEVEKAFACKESGCESSFDTQWQLNAHVKQVHDDWQPRSCTAKGCDPTITYQTKAQYQKHARLAHTTYKPTACTVPECSSKTVFATHNGYEAHLRLVHKLLGEAKAQHVGLSLPAWTPRSCQVPGCRFSTTIHKRRDHLRAHLEKQHGLDKDGMKGYLY